MEISIERFYSNCENLNFRGKKISMNLEDDHIEGYFAFFYSITVGSYQGQTEALIKESEITSEVGMNSVPVLEYQSIWKDGVNIVEPISEGVTTARNVLMICK